MTACMITAYGLFLSTADKNTEFIKREFRSNHSDENNEFSRIIFGRGPADLAELKKNTDKRRMELSEKARYNVPVEKSE